MTACSSKNNPIINNQKIEIANNSVDIDDEFDDEFEVADKEVFDPLEGYNRWMTSVNDSFYTYVFDPVSYALPQNQPELAFQMLFIT